jgi:hypothetical protein
VTVADRVAGGLVLVAGLFAGWACARAGATGWAVASCAVAGAIAASQAMYWTRSRRRPPLVLERRADGLLQVRQGTEPPVPVSVGAQTRFLGPSVYLDFTFASGRKTVRCRRWLTPFDVPAPVLRRWTVLLPGTGLLAS